MGMIDVFHITKDYKNHRGLFDVTFSVEDGECFGLLGPNGAGKTTMFRHLMGFIRAGEGECFINGRNCWDEATLIQKKLGYLPGELNLPEGMTGIEFLRFQARMRELKSERRMKKLIDRFSLDVNQPIRKMSKGTKQKLSIICAFMHNPQVLILDEPTTGLDPLMYNRFIELILEEKDIGKTIFLSSHNFDEIEKTCDRVGFIKDGKLLAIEDAKSASMACRKNYRITFSNVQDALNWHYAGCDIISVSGSTVSVSVRGELKSFLNSLASFDIINLDHRAEGLEDIFMEYFKKEK